MQKIHGSANLAADRKQENDQDRSTPKIPVEKNTALFPMSDLQKQIGACLCTISGYCLMHERQRWFSGAGK
jgi:hypothetical protein